MAHGVRGKLIALEGGEGVGKSTQAALLALRLGAVLTHEPGATPTGKALRSMLLDLPSPDSGQGRPSLPSKAEALLMAADRADHVSSVITPALDSGRWVVTDRFSYSTLAYQGYGRGLDVSFLTSLCDWASDGLWPDLNLLLVLDLDVALGRAGSSPDRLESEDSAFHRRVSSGFRALAAASPSSWSVIDAGGSVDEVAARIAASVVGRLGQP